jgi:recombinational DNA repair ATPase RecF
LRHPPAISGCRSVTLQRQALYERLENLGAQVFMTGADIDAFRPLQGRAQMLHVETGTVREIA